MSSLTKRENDILQLCLRILNADKPSEAVETYSDIIDSIRFSEVIWVVDELVKQNIPMEELKTGINKFLNLFYKALNNADIKVPELNTFLYYLNQNNYELDSLLKSIKQHLREINKNPESQECKHALLEKLQYLLKFENQYIIKENILFPLLETKWKDYRCLQVMWSFHDDIRRNIKGANKLLKEKEIDLDEFNSTVGDIFFDMYAIKFREEKILYPHILETISTEELNSMLNESLSFEWAFITPDIKPIDVKMQKEMTPEGFINLETGKLNVEQIMLMLNHLPVDITFVDEHNKVKYFSSPKKRIFPRSKAIIGREVNNCHPPESVHVVEKIVNAFRNGEKDNASFWIKMNAEYILIQYFAVRDSQNNYKGVIEVSQEISEIKNITGEKRLLDWND